MDICIRELTAEDDLSALLSLCKEFLTEYESHHEEPRNKADGKNKSDARDGLPPRVIRCVPLDLKLGR